jgi:hypothetical protein
MARRSSNPLPSWKQGIGPDQSGQEGESRPSSEPAPDYSVHSRDWMLMLRATRIVRQRYGIEAGDFSRWSPRLDKEALKVLDQLRQGKPVDRHQYIPPPPIDPFCTLIPRQASR